MRYLKALSVCAAFAAGLASPVDGKAPQVVVTAPPIDAVSRHIGYADLNLASVSGERALNRRVDYAVGDLCFEVTGGIQGSLISKPLMNMCRKSGWNQARPQIDQAVLRARQMAATGTSSISAATLTISFAP